MPIPKRKAVLSDEEKLLKKEKQRLKKEIEKMKGSQKKQQDALKKELKDAEAKRKTPKFNSKGQTVAKAVEEKKKVTAKKPTAKKPAAKKPTVKKPAAKKRVVKKPVAKKKAPTKLAKSLKSVRGTPSTPKATKALTRSLSNGRTTPKPTPKVAAQKLNASLTNTARGKPATPNSVKNTLLRSIKDSRTKPNAGKASVKANPKTTPSKTSGNSKMKQSLRGARGKPVTPNTNSVGPAGERIGGNPKTAKVGTNKLGTFGKSLGKKLLRLRGPLLMALQSEKLGGGTDMIDPKNPPKLYSGFKQTAPTAKKKKETAAKVATPKSETKKDTPKKKATTAMSFGAKFKKERKAGKSTFMWNGKSYSTATKDDVKASGSKNLREHLNKQNKKSK